MVFLFPQDTFASNLKINEVIVHPSSKNKEWVEFYNPDNIDISSYWIDDNTDFRNDSGNSSKKSLLGVQRIDTQYPYFEVSSMFNNDSDHVVLFGSDGTSIDQYEYSKDLGADISIGRSPDGSGDFAVLATATKGLVNSLPLPSLAPSPMLSPNPIKLGSTPTYTPTPTLLPKPKPITQSSSISIVKTVIGSAYQPATTTQISANISGSAEPTGTDEAIVGASISAMPTTIKDKTIVEGTKTQGSNMLLNIILFIGGGLRLNCGILFFLRRRYTITLESRLNSD